MLASQRARWERGACRRGGGWGWVRENAAGYGNRVKGNGFGGGVGCGNTKDRREGVGDEVGSVRG